MNTELMLYAPKTDFPKELLSSNDTQVASTEQTFFHRRSFNNNNSMLNTKTHPRRQLRNT